MAQEYQGSDKYYNLVMVSRMLNSLTIYTQVYKLPNNTPLKFLKSSNQNRADGCHANAPERVLGQADDRRYNELTLWSCCQFAMANS
jgi:hypothetical protein